MAKPTLSLDPFNMELMKRGVGGVPMTRKEAVIARSGGIEKPDNPATLIDNLQRGLNSFYQTIQAGGLSQQNQPYKVGDSPLSKQSSVGIEQEDIFTPSPEIATQPRVNFDEIAKAAIEEKKQNQEDFRKTEAALVEMQGGLKSQPVVGQGQDNNPNASGVEEKDPEVRAFMAGMDEFINAARGAAPNAPPVQDIEDYKKVFAEATGLDISGKPDKSSALMSLGLALMQNRAGSGFNVGNILRAVGQAGEKALPELQAARKEAKANAAAAGKYALEMRSSDQAKARAAQEKAMQRGKYYIMPKAEGISGFLSVMDEARPEYLNVTELNALITDPEFSQKYDLITEESFSGLADKVLDSGEAAELFSNTKSDIVLFSGDNVDSMFNFKVNDVNPNLPEGKSPKFAKMSNPGQAEQIYTALGDALQDINKFEETFAGAIANIDEDGATLQAQATNFLIQAADRLGIEVDANTPTAGLKKFVTKLQAQNAAEILGEAGKTLSDKDRQLVAEIVGDLPGLLSGSPDVLRTKLLELKTQVLDNKRREILRAFQTMDNYSRSSTVELWGDSDWSDDDEKELIKLRKTQGVDS